MEKVKWGFIGCGQVVQKKSGKAFNDVPHSCVHAIMRRNLVSAEESAKMFGAKKWYSSVSEIVNSDVDALYIATPPGLHFEQALACCEAGKPVYIEKPLARNYSEAKAMVEAFKLKNIPLFVGHHKRALPRFVYIKGVLDAGEIGKITSVQSYLNRLFSRKEAKDTWLYNPRLSGGGKFYDIAAHSIDIISFLFGEISEVHGFASNNGTECPLEDTVAFAYKTTKGVLGTANYNCISNKKNDRVYVHGTKGEIEFSVHGENDVIITSYGSGEKRTLTINDPESIEYSMVENVVEALINHGNGICMGEDALPTYWVIDEILDEFYNGRQRNFWVDYESRGIPQ